MSKGDFQQLVDRQYAPLFRFALSLAKSEAEAADLTQQTFFLWASKGDQLRDRSKAKSWLFTTLYREFLGRRRHEVRFPQVELDEAGEEQMSMLPNVDAFDSETVSFDIRWSGPVTDRAHVKDPNVGFAGEFVLSQATMTWSATNANGFRFRSDPSGTTSVFAQLRHMRNGDYYDE